MPNSLQRILSFRLVFAALVLAVSLIVTAPESFACPPTDIEYDYYTDATKTVQCGWKYITCSCSVTSSGCQTSYYDILYWPC
jgi:hypothetical protein